MRPHAPPMRRTCMISAESSPTMCAPTTRWLPASTTSFMKLRSGEPLMVLRMGRKLLVYTSTSPYCATACSSVRPWGFRSAGLRDFKRARALVCAGGGHMTVDDRLDRMIAASPVHATPAKLPLPAAFRPKRAAAGATALGQRKRLPPAPCLPPPKRAAHHGRDVGPAEHRRGHGLVVRLGRLPLDDGARQRHALHERDGRQVDAVCHLHARARARGGAGRASVAVFLGDPHGVGGDVGRRVQSLLDTCCCWAG